MKLASVIALAVALIAAAPGAARASDGLALRGYGTAVVDGVLSPGEWDTAGHVRLSGEPLSCRGRRDRSRDCVRHERRDEPVHGPPRCRDDPRQQRVRPVLRPAGVERVRAGERHPAGGPVGVRGRELQQTGLRAGSGSRTPADGGTQDGTSSVRVSGGVAVYEVAHPLNSADDLHDFSLTVPSHVDYVGLFQHCIAGSCAFTNSRRIRARSWSSRERTSRRTRRSRPALRTEPRCREYATFELAGTDDVAPPSEITFECKVDAQEWVPCETSFWSDATDEGWHTVERARVRRHAERRSDTRRAAVAPRHDEPVQAQGLAAWKDAPLLGDRPRHPARQHPLPLRARREAAARLRVTFSGSGRSRIASGSARSIRPGTRAT